MNSAIFLGMNIISIIVILDDNRRHAHRKLFRYVTIEGDPKDRRQPNLLSTELINYSWDGLLYLRIWLRNVCQRIYYNILYYPNLWVVFPVPTLFLMLEMSQFPLLELILKRYS